MLHGAVGEIRETTLSSKVFELRRCKVGIPCTDGFDIKRAAMLTRSKRGCVECSEDADVGCMRVSLFFRSTVPWT
jgi:hypothetical protein